MNYLVYVVADASEEQLKKVAICHRHFKVLSFIGKITYSDELPTFKHQRPQSNIPTLPSKRVAFGQLKSKENVCRQSGNSNCCQNLESLKNEYCAKLKWFEEDRRNCQAELLHQRQEVEKKMLQCKGLQQQLEAVSMQLNGAYNEISETRSALATVVVAASNQEQQLIVQNEKSRSKVTTLEGTIAKLQLERDEWQIKCRKAEEKVKNYQNLLYNSNRRLLRAKAKHLKDLEKKGKEDKGEIQAFMALGKPWRDMLLKNHGKKAKVKFGLKKN